MYRAALTTFVGLLGCVTASPSLIYNQTFADGIQTFFTDSGAAYAVDNSGPVCVSAFNPTTTATLWQTCLGSSDSFFVRNFYATDAFILVVSLNFWTLLKPSDGSKLWQLPNFSEGYTGVLVPTTPAQQGLPFVTLYGATGYDDYNAAKLIAIDSATGKQKWQTSVVVGDALSVFSSDNKLVISCLNVGSEVCAAFSVETGEQVWSVPLPPAPNNKTGFFNGGINVDGQGGIIIGGGYLSSYSNVQETSLVWKLRESDGKTLWLYTHDLSARGISNAQFSLTLAGGMVYQNNGDATIALSAGTGTLKWSLSNFADNVALKGITDSVLYLFAFNNSSPNVTVAAVNLGSGFIMWALDNASLPVYPEPTGVDVIMMTDHSSTVEAVDPANGRTVWTFTPPAIAGRSPYTTISAVVGNVVWGYSSSQGTLQLLVWAFKY